MPAELHVADAAIADPRERLTRTRFPDQAPGPAWAYGTDLDYMRQLIEYWHDSFDWRAQKAQLNAFPQCRIPLFDIDLHFLHVPGRGPSPFPLLPLHGWPGSVFEFLEIILHLTDRARVGGDPADAFTVVAPSLPGYGLSFTPGQRRFGVEEIADCVAAAMCDPLGCAKCAVQRGDRGAITASRLGYAHPDHLIGIHVNLLAVRREPPQSANPTPEEQWYAEELTLWPREETAYQWIERTRPQTLAFALSDSPAGLAAWIVENLPTWSDCGGDIESVFLRDRLLANIAAYWFTGASGSSFWPYYERNHRPLPVPEGETVDVPTGYAAFPCEILRPPRSLAARTYTDIRRSTAMPRGSHFAAMEQPEALAGEVQAFFRELRG